MLLGFISNDIYRNVYVVVYSSAIEITQYIYFKKDIMRLWGIEYSRKGRFEV